MNTTANAQQLEATYKYWKSLTERYGLLLPGQWSKSFESFLSDMDYCPEGSVLKVEGSSLSRSSYSWHRLRGGSSDVTKKTREKLTDLDVAEILRLVYEDGVSVSNIPLLYPVSEPHARAIVRGKTRRVKGFSYVLTPKIARKGPSPRLSAEQWAELCERYKKGERIALLAPEYGLTVGRVYQLLAKA